ncbi:MAG TPA: DNA mismatch repair endonuclease MutL [Methanocorpusculum sp.]|nr:DNA mismatch repair endonuclease MutL [Methanocorpusculum sp.]
MSRIHVLDEETVNRIAAGEVVERPASIVKELVENSIDAGADRISVDIRSDAKNITGISVSDNGCGVSAEDAVLAFRQHATSKIEHPDDLDRIGTLGFRGEALASIAAVSKVTFTSKERGCSSPEAVQIVIHGGTLIKQGAVGAPGGTVITAEDIFYNTPARKKFQKSISTELSHIYDMTERLALAHRNVSITLLFNGKERFRTYGTGSYTDAVASVFGTGFAKQLIPVSASNAAASVSGWITRPGVEMRPTPSRFYITINSRQVVSRTIQWAVREGYGTLLPKGMYPAAFLDISVDLREVDVNVHPTKREVRISQEREVASAVQDAVYCALHEEWIFSAEKPAAADTQATLSAEQSSPEKFSLRKSASEISASKISASDESIELKPKASPVLSDMAHSSQLRAFSSRSSPPTLEETVASILTSHPPESDDTKYLSAMERERAAAVGESRAGYASSYTKMQYTPTYSTPRKTEQQLKRTEHILSVITGEDKTEAPAFPVPEVITQIAGTYILAKDAEDNLLIIDQHAAHERIMYDALLKKSREEKAGQELLVPVTLTLSRGEAAVLPDILPVLEKAGYVIEPFGEGVWAVRFVPVISSKLGSPEVVHEIIAEASGNAEKNPERALDRVLKTAACRAVVKGNTALTKQQMEELLHQLAKTESPYTCPHGRPTVVTLSKSDLEKMFLRG